jgi:hypothetical protein
MNLDTVLEQGESFIVRTVGEDTIFLSEKGDDVHMLNETGTLIWGCIDGRRSLRAVLQELCRTYDVSEKEAVQDLMRFAEEMTAKGLVRARPE